MAKISLDPAKAVPLLHPGMTALVTCMDDVQDNIITITWQCPFSGNPPTVGISVSPKRFSYNMIMNSGKYVINIPNLNLLKQVHFCGIKSGRDVDKFAETGLTRSSAQVLDVPLIEECVGHVECDIVSTHPAGEHTIFIAKVVAVSAEETLFKNSWETGPGALESLHYLGGTKYAVLGRTIDTKKIPE